MPFTPASSGGMQAKGAVGKQLEQTSGGQAKKFHKSEFDFNKSFDWPEPPYGLQGGEV